jgi:hypothetical protein
MSHKVGMANDPRTLGQGGMLSHGEVEGRSWV